MKWIPIHEYFPPLDTPVLVQHKDYSFEVLRFYNDEEYGFIAASFESYVSINNILKWCLIEN